MKKLPKKIDICGVEHEVLFPYEFLDKDYLGLYERYQLRIKVSGKYYGVDRPWLRIIETFIHEILHGIDFIMCDGKFNHDVINSLSYGWMSVLSKNNLFGAGIPKKVHINGFVYDVKYPFVFPDDDTILSQVVNHLLVIRIAGNDSVEKFHVEFVRQHLIQRITNAIIFNYLHKDEPDNEDLTTLSSGIYQTFRKIDWNKIVKG